MNCPVCQSDQSKALVKWRNTYTIYRCGSCDLLYADPLPSPQELDDFYQGFLFKIPSEEGVNRELQKRKDEISRLFKITSKDKGKRFLDYGGGNGVVTKAAQDMGLDAVYLDIDEKAKEFVSGVLGVPKSNMKRDLSELQGQQFDYIFSDNVIEHERLPYDHVENLYKLLKPGGKLLIKTPNASNNEAYFYPLVMFGTYLKQAARYNGSGLYFKGLGLRFWHCDPPRHIFSFSAKSFEVLCKKAGYPEYQVEFYRPPLYENTLAKYWFSKPKRNKGAKGILLRVGSFPFLIPEALFKLLHAGLRGANALSPGGLILVVSKPA